VTRHEEVVAAAVAEQERRDLDALGRLLNPDTGAPYPSASQAQLELVEEVWDRLAGSIDTSTEDAIRIRDALVEAVVRQHGRTLRACLADVRAAGDSFYSDARVLAQDALDGASPETLVDPGKLSSAGRLAAAAAALRTVVLRGDRA
jgi:hypothetical protein